jgi:hypothetical protein
MAIGALDAQSRVLLVIEGNWLRAGRLAEFFFLGYVLLLRPQAGPASQEREGDQQE